MAARRTLAAAGAMVLVGGALLLVAVALSVSPPGAGTTRPSATPHRSTPGTRSVPADAAPRAVPARRFRLSADYHRFDAVDDALAARLTTASVDTVMRSANHTRAGPGAHGPPGQVAGFGFDPGDSADCTNYPQGITSSRDAVGDADDGTYDGHQLLLVSWYTEDGCDGATARSRITLIDWDASWPNTYRKVLLVAPTGTSAAPDFTDIPIHAGGVSWYGDRLYVADTDHGLRVFDLRRILATEPGGDADQIGRQPDGTYRAHRYAYVLPQVGTVSAAGVPLVWSTISLDRSSASLVLTEYTCASGCSRYPNRPARAVRFPFAPGTTRFAASTTASQALRLPWYQLNGVASHRGRWWFASSGTRSLYSWSPRAGPRRYGWVGGAESISYWAEPGPDPDLLWSLTEVPGRRTVFAVEPPGRGP